MSRQSDPAPVRGVLVISDLRQNDTRTGCGLPDFRSLQRRPERCGHRDAAVPARHRAALSHAVDPRQTQTGQRAISGFHSGRQGV